MDTPTALALIGLGVLTGTLGTLIGVGGGFLVVPVFLLAFPRLSPTDITSISLAAIFLGSLSGLVAYARMRRIDYRSGLAFAMGTVPGAVLGANLVKLVPREPFQVLFGCVLGLVGIYLAIRPSVRPRPSTQGPNRVLTDRTGQTFTYRVEVGKGMLISLGVGVLSAILGVGGGVFLVPAMVAVMGVPPLIAAPTSVFILSFTSASATATHALAGHLDAHWPYVLLLAFGMITGAQVAARIARRIASVVLVRLLGLVLGSAGIYLLLLGLDIIGARPR
ncbi:MAG: sulfite exporter TauE/SafE family protein [Chloroflexota bacterium]|nr:sulfite exporter TauE/SafE family protein [Chloroflexota bacterium]